ncbi:Transposon Tf2-6 polyprotein, partial [Dictyocoela muelleri]
TDNGKEFCNSDFNNIIKKYKMVHIKGRPRYPESQGQIERFNGTLKRRLSKCLYGKEKKWINVLRDVVHQYNNSIHSATSCTPFSAFRQIRLGINSISSETLSSSELKNKYENYVANLYKNEKISALFNVGDRVLLAKDFDNNIKTKGNPLDSDFYEIVYYVLESIDDLLFIRNDNGEKKWVNYKRVKKI